MKKDKHNIKRVYFTIANGIMGRSFSAVKIKENYGGGKLLSFICRDFDNPFDAYFYLLENFKEEEIV
jgi:hypothetical protein